MGSSSLIDFRTTYATPLPADGAIPFDLTAKERDDAAFAQAQLRFDARRSSLASAREGKPA